MNTGLRLVYIMIISMIFVMATACGGAGGGESGSSSSSRFRKPTPLETAEWDMEQAAVAIADGDIELALEYYLDAAKFYGKIGEVTIERGEAHYQAGDMAQRLSDFETAITQYNESIGIYVRFKGNSKIKAAIALTNLGVIYKQMDEKSKARGCWTRALEIYNAADAKARNYSHMETIEQNIRDLDQGL